MRIGFQTIVFGPDMDDLDHQLALIAAAGFEGVEFAQPVDRIRRVDPATGIAERVSAADLAAALERHGLELLGLSGGPLETRVAFCRSAGLTPRYLYVDDLKTASRDAVDAAVRQGYRIAFHPHAFMTIERLAHVESLFTADNPHLYWLPDTAHLYIVGGSFRDIDAALQVPRDRLIAVHLKDWDPAYGRSYHRYAKGFVPLGRGNVPLERVLARLRALDYDGWLVFEQDYARIPADRCIADAARWLREHGVPLRPAAVPAPALPPSPPRRWSTIQELERAERLTPFARAMAIASTERLDDCYRTLARAVRDLTGALHVSLWAYRPGRDQAELFSVLGKAARNLSTSPWVPTLVLSETTLKHRAVLDRAPALARVTDDAVYEELNRARDLGAAHVLCLPVLNRFNHHHIRFVVEIHLPEDSFVPTEAEAAVIADLLAESADGALDDACSYVAGKVQLIAGRSQNMDVLNELRDLVAGYIDCEAVTIFLANPAQDRLEAWASTGIEWQENLPIHERCYGAHTEAGSPTVRVWRDREILLMVNGQETPHTPSSWETTADPSRDNILLAPLVNVTIGDDGEERAQAIGVIRCRNKRRLTDDERTGPEESRVPAVRYFNQDDAAILDAICQSCVPHIRLLVSDLRRRKAVADMTHELSKPINSVRAAVDKLRSDLGRIDRELIEITESFGPRLTDEDRRILRAFAEEGHRKYFRQDYIRNILSWTRLMIRVIGNADVYGLRSVVPDLEIEHAYLMADVVAPAADMAEYLLRRRGFDKSRIRYDSFVDIPKLYIDVNLFQQVFFNLLSNSIKYAFNDPKAFAVEIATRVRGDMFCIAFRDWGPGIDPSHEKSIFEEGVRGPEYLSELVGGLGLGLWVVREVVRLHGGTVEVTHNGQPTEITIFLPRSLASARPRPRPATGN